MPDVSTAARVDLVTEGVAAYRQRNYKLAAKHLQMALDESPRDWTAKLYLAMALFNDGEIYTAHRHFSFLRDNCPDTEICDKARAALQILDTKVQGKARVFEPATPPVADEAAELEWVKGEY